MTPSHATEDDPPLDEPSVEVHRTNAARVASNETHLASNGTHVASDASSGVAPSADVAPELHDGGDQ